MRHGQPVTRKVAGHVGQVTGRVGALEVGVEPHTQLEDVDGNPAHCEHNHNRKQHLDHLEYIFTSTD